MTPADPAALPPGTSPPAPAGGGLSMPVLLLALLLGTLVFIALGEFVEEHWIRYYATRLWLPLWWIGGLVFGGGLLVGRGPWVRRTVRLTRYQFVDLGGGAYGGIALVCFGWLEWAQIRDLLEWIAQTDWYTDKFGVRSIVRDLGRNIIDFFVGSFMNGVYAFIWPAFHGKVFAARGFWQAAVVGFIVFEFAKRGARQLSTMMPRA